MKNDSGKKKRIRLFDLNAEGRGISKTASQMPPGFKRFFITYWENFAKIVSVNMYFVLGNFPLLFLAAALSGFFKTTTMTPLSDVFQNISGLMALDGGHTPFTMTVNALVGLQNTTYVPTVVTYIFYAIGALGLFTFGPVNAGTAYILRNLVKGEPLFLWSDFWYAVRRNWKQALPFGMVDIGITFLLGFNLYNLITGTSAFFASMLFWSNVLIALLFFFMRYYVYVQMVTFRLSVFKIVKNSLIFTLLGLKRNLVAFLGILVLILFEIFFLFGAGGILLPFAVAIPLAILFSTCAFMKVYASYFKIKEIMIDPYQKEDADTPSDDSEEPIMHDDVTERERLREIKRRNGISDS